MAAPTFVSFGATAFNSAATPKTVSITVQNGDRIVAMAVGESGGSLATTAPTGGSLTYAQRASVPASTNGSAARAIAWTTTATSATTFSVSFSIPTTDGTLWWGGMVWVWRASDGFGTNFPSAVTGSNTLAITTTGANSALVAASADWNAVDGTTRTRRTVNGSTGTEDTYFRDSAHYSAYGQRYADAGATGSKTVGYSAPTGQTSAIIAIEVLGSAGVEQKSGTGTITQTADTVTSTGTKTASGTATLTESAPTLTSTGVKAVSGTGAITQTADTVISSGTKTASGTGAISQTNTLTGSGSPVVQQKSGTGTITQTADTVTSTGTKAASGIGAITEAAPTLVSTGTKAASGTADLIEAAPTVTGSGSPVAPGGETFYFPSAVGWTPTGSFSDPAPLNLGTYFNLTEAADITGVRFWAPSATTFTAQLWADGVKVAEVTGVSASAGVWTEALFSTPVAGATGVGYIASALQATGTAQYTARSSSFGVSGVATLVTVGPVTSNTTDNGLFVGNATDVPSGGFGHTWYGVDVIVEGEAAVISGSGEITQTSDVTSTGFKQAFGTGSISQDSDVTGSGDNVETVSGTGSISQSSSLTASGTKSVSGSGSEISQISFMGSSGFKIAIGGATLDFYSEVTGSGSSTTSTNKSGTGSISQSSSLTSSGAKSVGGLGAISQASAVTGSGFPGAPGQRNILITGVTEPTTGWLTTEMQSGWTSTDPTAAWGTTEAGNGWTSTEPATSAQWATTEPSSGTITTEPVLTYTATEPTI